MEYKLLNTAIVVLSEGNNPKLLNHDFLTRNKIVPDEWEMRDILVTPPFSHLKYKNGVELTVEINKLQIKVENPEALAWDVELPRMARQYLQVLPHVNYTGVGINFVFIAGSYPREPLAKLLHSGPWLTANGGLSSAAIELHFKNSKPRLNVKIEQHPDAGRKSDEHLRLVLFANYHHDFLPQEEQARADYISKAAELKTSFLEFAQSLPFS
jgi:hypothetical protein